MDDCFVEDCENIKEVKSILRRKVSLSTLTIVAGVVTICIGSVVAVYGYVMQDSLSRIIAEEAQITTNTILASENRVEITNLKRSLFTKNEFKSMLREVLADCNEQ